MSLFNRKNGSFFKGMRTGKTDKNGSPIREGSTVLINERAKAIVRFNVSESAFTLITDTWEEKLEEYESKYLTVTSR